jgi:hypothetical protein
LFSYLLQTGTVDESRLAFQADLFHTTKHLLLQAREGWMTGIAVDAAGRIHALVPVHVQDGIACSPYRAPYGSVIFAESFTEENLNDLLTVVEQRLNHLGVHTLQLKQAPVRYTPEHHARCERVLLQRGYRVVLEETTAIIEISDAAFESGLHRSKKSRLNKALSAGCTFRFVGLEHLDKVYQFLAACRAKKNYSLSMTYPELHATVYAFPERFVLAVVEHEQRWIAASVAIQVNRKVLYHFYYDHHDAYDALSPVVLLTQGLYRYCRRNAIELLDMGTSMLHGAVNQPVLNFKLDLGATPSYKRTFEKKLSE